MLDVLRRVRTDGAIVTEPTELAVVVAHKGFAWIEITVRGRAAHGSRFDQGVDANLRLGRVLAALEKHAGEVLRWTPHRLLGPPSLHVGLVRGGTAPSVYAASATATIERRMLPDETEASVLAELDALIDPLRHDDPTFAADVRCTLHRPGHEAAPDSAVLEAVRHSAERVLGAPPTIGGVGYWMDAALLAAAGIDTVTIGPSGAGAHADVEWVDLESVARTADILAESAIRYCGAS
jgi:acetylornithine deacetylase